MARTKEMKVWAKMSKERADLESILSVRRVRGWALCRAALPNHAQLLYDFIVRFPSLEGCFHEPARQGCWGVENSFPFFWPDMIPAAFRSQPDGELFYSFFGLPGRVKFGRGNGLWTPWHLSARR